MLAKRRHYTPEPRLQTKIGEIWIRAIQAQNPDLAKLSTKQSGYCSEFDPKKVEGPWYVLYGKLASPPPPPPPYHFHKSFCKLEEVSVWRLTLFRLKIMPWN